MQDMYADDGVFDLSAVFTDIAPTRGHENMRRCWDELWEAWEGIRMDPLEVFDVGDSRYVVAVRLWGKGKRSGVEVDQRFAFLYTLRPEDEKIVRADSFYPGGQSMPVDEAALAIVAALPERVYTVVPQPA